MDKGSTGAHAVVGLRDLILNVLETRNEFECFSDVSIGSDRSAGTASRLRLRWSTVHSPCRCHTLFHTLPIFTFDLFAFAPAVCTHIVVTESLFLQLVALLCLCFFFSVRGVAPQTFTYNLPCAHFRHFTHSQPSTSRSVAWPASACRVRSLELEEKG